MFIQVQHCQSIQDCPQSYAIFARRKGSEGLLNETHRGNIPMRSIMFRAAPETKDKTVGFPVECRQSQSEGSPNTKIGGESGLAAIKSVTGVGFFFWEGDLVLVFKLPSL